MRKRAIVTGVTGFIGSWLAQQLLKDHVEITVITRNASKLLPEFVNDRNCIIIEKDVGDIEIEDFSTGGYDYFVHLAWGGVAPEEKNDVELQLHNVAISLKALEVAHSLGCKKFIASGTVAEYALCGNVIDLNGKQSPNDIYGAAKVSAHHFLEVRARQLGQNFNWVILPSTYGPRRTDNNIITYTIKSLLKGEKPMYGSLTQMWDFLYVGEVVKAIIAIAEKGRPNKVYGIGSGRYRPLSSYVEDIRDTINPALPLGIGVRANESRKTCSSCVNIYDLIADTGFIPKEDFAQNIKTTICAMETWVGR